MTVTVPRYEEDPHDATQIEVPRRDDGNLRDQIMRRWVRNRPIHRQSDCLFAFLCCSVLIMLTFLVVTQTYVLTLLANYVDVEVPVLLPVFTRTLLYSIITLHSLKHPDEQHNINFFPVPGRWVPMFHLGFGMVMGYRIIETVHGVVIGLLYAFLVREKEWLAPLVGRKRIISTPQWLIQLVGEDKRVINGNDIIFDRYPGVHFEEGANALHHASAIGDTVYIQYMIGEVESRIATYDVGNSSSDFASVTAPFRQKDRNGWQPLHEAARAGNIDVLRLLLEVDNVTVSSENRIRRRAGKLKIDVNARTDDDRGVTALRLVEDNHGADSDCAELLREVGGISLGFGDETSDEE